MAETRKQLTPKQIDLFKQLRDNIRRVEQDLERAHDKFSVWAALVLDGFGVAPEAKPRVDETTWELVIPDAPMDGPPTA